MRVLVISPRSDLAGTGIGIKMAFDRHSDIEVRAVRRIPKSYEYPVDADWSELDELTRRSDLVHVMEIAESIPAGKRAVLHHHGSYFRTNRDRILREQTRRGAIGVCSTIDLYLLEAGEWIPAPYDIDWLGEFRSPQPILTIAHAGTDPDSKSTGPFLAACKRLGKEMRIGVLLIGGMSWIECLRVKGTADIYFDQTLTGYGNNAIEAWGMGIPVIAGIEPAEARRRGHLIPDGTPDQMVRMWGELPFVRADEGTIYDALKLLTSRAERSRWADKGLAHVRRFHSQKAVVQKLEQVYAEAIT